MRNNIGPQSSYKQKCNLHNNEKFFNISLSKTSKKVLFLPETKYVVGVLQYTKIDLRSIVPYGPHDKVLKNGVCFTICVIYGQNVWLGECFIYNPAWVFWVTIFKPNKAEVPEKGELLPLVKKKLLFSRRQLYPFFDFFYC